MNKEEIEVMSKLQQKAIRYKTQKRLKMAFNDDEYYSYILFNLIQNTRKENTNLKQAINEIRKYINSAILGELDNGSIYYLKDDEVGKHILQIIDKVGDEK